MGLWRARRAGVVGLLLLPAWAEGRRPGWAELGARCGQLAAGPTERRGKGVLGQAGRARASGPEGRSGELGLLAPWAEMASLFTSLLPISFLFLTPLYLLPSALGWYICVAYHVFTQVGSTRVYYRSRDSGLMVGTNINGKSRF